jgi:hypothetical protein
VIDFKGLSISLVGEDVSFHLPYIYRYFSQEMIKWGGARKLASCQGEEPHWPTKKDFEKYASLLWGANRWNGNIKINVRTWPRQMRPCQQRHSFSLGKSGNTEIRVMDSV